MDSAAAYQANHDEVRIPAEWDIRYSTVTWDELLYSELHIPRKSDYSNMRQYYSWRFIEAEENVVP